MKIQPRTSTSTYAWGPGKESHFDSDPQIIGEHIDTLIEANNGQVTPPVVVEDARNPASPLHPEFEWDDPKAAELYRLDRAKLILRSIVVIEIGDHIVDSEPRAFVSVRTPENKPYYTSTVYAMQQPDLREQILRQAWRDLENWRRKYEHLEEFAGIIDAVRRVDIDALTRVPA